MALRVLIFFPHNPWPPCTGAHHRGLEVLAGLRELGASVSFASSTLTSETPWTADSKQALQDRFRCSVEVYEATPADWRYTARLWRWYERLHWAVPVDSAIYSPPAMRRWFSRWFEQLKPEAVVVNYAYWDGLISRRMRREAITVIDTLDLITLHQRLSAAVEQQLPRRPIQTDEIRASLVSETFFEALHLDAARREYQIVDRYTHCLAISPLEASRIRAQARHTRVTHVPMTYPAQALQTDYSGSGLFPTGPNLLNLQGYCYFVKRVLPQVLAAAPAFLLTVTGSVCNSVAPQPGIELRGFIEPLADLYASSAFVICPVLGKTGQQVKIVEAMAHGLPVVATRAGAEGSPIVHGENGLIANDAAEFAEYVLRLWRDREFCKQLGRSAREHIAAHFNSTQLAAWLAPLFERSEARVPA